MSLTILLVAAACGAGEGSDGAIIAPSSDAQRAGVSATAPIADTAAALNTVGFALLATQPGDENVVLSPSSVGHALLMARAAADDTTAASIDAALGLPPGVPAHEAWNAVDVAIAGAANSEDELTITIADRIWPRSDVTPSQDWVDLLATYHGADTETLDFIGDSAGSTERINEWVSEQTSGLIPQLLPAGFIKPNTVLVLTDTLYFKARWQNVFGKYGIESGPFTLLDGSTVQTQLMRELELRDVRGSGDGFVGAEIPYVGNEFSMLVIVPDEGRFAEVRDRLDNDFLAGVDASFTTGPYELLIPKWEDDTQIDLLDWLTEIGAAPGSYPAITPDAFLDAAVHGADIAVDEWGTVAAAATAFGFNESGPPEPELTVRADRPFLYLIRHRPSGLVLFIGQVVNPEA